MKKINKQRSIGLSLASLISVVFFGYSFLFFLFFFPTRENPWFVILRYGLCLLVSLAGFIASVFIFDIRRWAQKLMLYSCIFFLSLGLVTDFTNMTISGWYGVSGFSTLIYATFSIRKLGLYIFWLMLVVFLTRPDVKKQLK
ncbi:MAG: hypothetical protein C4533_07740 [Candidatus Omnitrophota bacterium]|jgi:hypothetical protein|nr:MAG: hypothetical protein C4533_07740 [Candidatus Omnitrophota bacterium]